MSPVKPAFLADIVAKRVQGDDDDRATTNEDDRRERKNSNGPISDAAWGQPIGEEVLKSSVPIGSLRARYEQQQNQQQQPEHPKPNIPSATVVVNKVQHQGKALDVSTIILSFQLFPRALIPSPNLKLNFSWCTVTPLTCCL